MPVYDDEKVANGADSASDDELRRLTGIGKDEEDAMDREAHNGAADDIAEKGGLFNAADTASPMGRLKQAGNFMWGSKKRKAATTGVGLGVGGLGVSLVMLFMSLVPLKIESIVSNLENRYGAAGNMALQKETDSMFKDYLKKYVIGNLGRKGCRSTVDSSCVSLVTGDGPIAKMYKGWRKDKLTEKMATKYGFTLAKSGNTYYINTNGRKFDFKDKASLEAVMSDNGTTKGTRAEIEQIMATKFKEGTLWDRMYARFRVAPKVNAEFGTRHCVNACRQINQFTDTVAVKKMAAKGYILDRVLTPLSLNYSFILQCALMGEGECNVKDLRDAAPGDTNVETDANKGMQKRLGEYASRFTDEKLADLVGKANKLGEDGMTKFLVGEVTRKLVEIGGGDGARAEATAAKAVDPITWALIAAQLAEAGRNIGPILKYMTYSANAAAAAQLFTTYQTVASETKSGQIDAAQLGSFNNALDTSLDTSDTSSIADANKALKGTGTTASSATQTPYYQSIMGSPGTQVSLLGGTDTAYAASTSNSSSGYGCDEDGGAPVPTGQTVCSVEKLDRGTDMAGFIETMSGWYNTYLNYVPGANQILGVLNFVNKGINWGVDKIFTAFSKAVKITCKIPGIHSKCESAKAAMTAVAGKALDFVLKFLINSPFIHLSGGRLFDMIGAGASVVYNKTAQENLGAPHVSDATAASIQTAYLSQQQAEFDHRSVFARMFSTDTPYSLISRVAVSLPGNLTTTGYTMASSLSHNPLSVFGNAFASLFTVHRTFAAANAATVNPFGIPQAAYLPSEIPSNPQQFWDQNCKQGPDGWWTESAPAGQQLDISQWLNKKDSSGHYVNVEQDSDTGQTYYKHANPCLLILASVQAAGGKSDPSLLPEDALATTGTSGGGQLRVATFNVEGQPHTPGTWQQRADKAISAIEHNQPDIVGFQEFEQDQPKYFLSRLAGYGSYGGSPNTIIWNKDKYTLESSGMQPNLVYFCPAGSNTPNKLQAPYIKLRDNATGQEFYVMNTHDPANSSNDHCSDPSKNRYIDANEHVKFIKQLSQDGLPIIFTGDFNSRYDLKKGGNGSPYQGKAENLTYCIFTKSGVLNDAYDAYSNRAVNCPNKTPPGAGGGIDHVYLSKDITVNGYTSVTPPSDGSDHPVLFYDLTFPGGGGGTGGTTAGQPGSDFVGPDGFSSGWCTDYVNYILLRHAPTYHGGSYPDGKDWAQWLHNTYGYTKNHTPAIHAVVSFPGPPYGHVTGRYAGHVALVAQINKDGSIIVEESNFLKSMHYGTHEVSASEAKTLWYAHTDKGWH